MDARSLPILKAHAWACVAWSLQSIMAVAVSHVCNFAAAAANRQEREGHCTNDKSTGTARTSNNVHGRCNARKVKYVESEFK
uniref:Secreted protein n=1 Tax=Arundo donax TaxID=35708 RepID=A0A0A9B2N0_ARUDO